MKQETYSVGIVGCGRIGSDWDLHSDLSLPRTHAGAFATLPRTKVVAGANRGRERLEAFGRKWGVSALYQDAQAMLDQEQLDIVCIATHPELHKAQVIAAARSGVKGILCEKPIALSLAEADAMIGACDKAGVVLLINHSRRWSPVYHQAQKRVESGAIGQLLTIVGHCQGVKPHPAWRAAEEGPLLHDATHTFDAFRFFAGDVQWVLGTAVRRSHPYRVEDQSLSILQFKSGVSGIAVVNELTEYARFDVELQGTHGKIALGSSGNGLWSSVPSVRAVYERDPTFDWQHLAPGAFPETPPTSSIQEAAKEMVLCLDTGKAPSSSGRDGRAALEIVMAIYESQRRGNVPIALPLPGGPSLLHQMREEGLM
jgi:predicted dehydrogenase